MAKNYLPDTCFWIALYDKIKDPQNHEAAETIAKRIEDGNIIIPYPSLYEFLGSRFSRKGSAHEFHKLMSRPNISLVDDEKYRQDSFENFFNNAKYRRQDTSLVDEIIKLMICDPILRVDFLLTFDSGLINYAIAHGVSTN